MTHSLTWQRAAMVAVTLLTLALLLYTIGAPVGHSGG
jgi:hypothetical protein